MFSIEEAATLLDVDVQYIRSQVTTRGGLIYDSKRPRGAGIAPDELLALGVLKSVQRITGKQAPIAQEIVRRYRPFLAGVLQTPGRTIPDALVPLVEGAVTVNVQLRTPWLPEWLRQRVALLRAGKALESTTAGALTVEGMTVAAQHSGGAA